jgi:hypothetical protein
MGARMKTQLRVDELLIAARNKSLRDKSIKKLPTVEVDEYAGVQSKHPGNIPTRYQSRPKRV